MFVTESVTVDKSYDSADMFFAFEKILAVLESKATGLGAKLDYSTMEMERLPLTQGTASLKFKVGLTNG